MGMNEQKSTSANHIEWTRVMLPDGTRTRGYTWNPIAGCQHGCRWEMPDGKIAECYAENVAENVAVAAYPQGFSHHYWKPAILTEPAKLKQGAGIFVGSMADVFGAWVEEEQINAVLDACRKAPQHIFFMLTKNAPRLLKFDFPDNVWVGASSPPDFMFGKQLSLEQKEAMLHRTLKVLSEVKAKHRWMSIEPLSRDYADIFKQYPNALTWAVIGGASDGKRKFPPSLPDLIRALVVLDDHNVPVFFKGNLHTVTWASAHWREDFPTSPTRAPKLVNSMGKSAAECLDLARENQAQAFGRFAAQSDELLGMYAALASYWYEAAARLRPVLPLPLQIVPQLEAPLIPPTFPLLLAVILPDGVARSSDPHDPGFVPPEFVYVIGTEYARLDQVDKTRELYERHQKYLQSEEGKQLTAQTDAMMQDRVVDPDPIPDVPTNKIEPDYADPFDLPTNTKVLSLWQPWASLLMNDAKHIETRSWGTPHRGTLVIHAAKKWDHENIPYATLEEPFVSALRAAGLDPNSLPLGAALGTVILDTVQDTSAVRDMLNAQELAFGNFEDGRKAWCVSRPKAFKKPLKVNGRQGLRDWKEYLEEIAPASEPMKMFEQPAPPDTPISKTRVVNFQDVKAHWDTKRRMWDSDEYVYIGRQNGTYGLPESRFANPFKITSDTPENRAYAIEQYRLWLTAKLVDPFADTAYRVELETLRGKTLVCWCSSDSPAKSKACHGDVLLKALGELPEAHSHAEPERMTEAASIQMSMFGDFKTYA